jgi:hypothetical protein
MSAILGERNRQRQLTDPTKFSDCRVGDNVEETYNWRCEGWVRWKHHFGVIVGKATLNSNYANEPWILS